jgi:arylsulfatase A-like enzyme
MWWSTRSLTLVVVLLALMPMFNAPGCQHHPACRDLKGVRGPSCRGGGPVVYPFHLLDLGAESSTPPKMGSLTTGGETRPALLESARFPVELPEHGLLTFGLGVAMASEREPPGWYQFTLRSGDRTLAERKLNPRALRGWRDISVPLDGLGRDAVLEFELALTDRDGRPAPAPADLLLGVAEPVIHDLEAYGAAKVVLFVSIDTLRRDHVGVYGYERPTTPRLDALAKAGIVCDDAVSTSSWTLPAHLSMLTSHDPGSHGGIDLEHGFNKRVPTLPGVLKAAGFATQAVTSHLYVSSTYGVQEGFDHLDFLQDRKANDVAGRAIEILDRLGDRPLFLFLHFYDPHWHYDPPEAARKLFERPYDGRITGLWQDFSKRAAGKVSPADLQHLLDLYDGEIRAVDDELGRILDHMKARGIDRNALVAVTSDHGEEFLEHGSWEHQKTLYEEVIRVPLIVSGSGVARRREKTQTSILDLMPTILEWSGAVNPPHVKGRSLFRSLPEGDAYGETDHTTDHTYKAFLRGGQDGWKAVFSLDGEGRPLREEWFDLSKDPGEKHPLKAPADTADGVRKRALERWSNGRKKSITAPTIQLTPEQRQRLRALGYVGP